MKQPMNQQWKRVLAAGIAAVLVVGLPLASSAKDPVASSAKSKNDDATRAQWVKKYQALKDKRAKLQHDYDQAVADYSRGRTTRHLAGGGKAGLVDEIAQLKDELAKVDQQIADFPDEARKAGALPGWFRDDDASASADAGASPDQTRARGLSSAGSRSLSTGSSRSLGRATNDEETGPAARADDEEEAAGGNDSSSSHGLPGLGSHQPSHHGLH